MTLRFPARSTSSVSFEPESIDGALVDGRGGGGGSRGDRRWPDESLPTTVLFLFPAGV